MSNWYVANEQLLLSRKAIHAIFLADTVLCTIGLNIISQTIFTKEARSVCILTGLQAQESIHSCRRSNAVNSEKLLEDDLQAQLCRGGDDIRFN